jgi:hypothetical protein
MASCLEANTQINPYGCRCRPLHLLIFVLGQCMVGRSFAQTSIGEVTGSLDKSQTCKLADSNSKGLRTWTFTEGQ